MPIENYDSYWDSHRTKYGKRDRMSQGSVADRGGYNDMPAYTQENMGGKSMTYGQGNMKSVNGYGFGKKKNLKNRNMNYGGGY